MSANTGGDSTDGSEEKERPSGPYSVEIPYNFQHFDNVPTDYMSTGAVAKAVEMDSIIPVIQQIEDRYDMGSIVSEVIRRNQEAIDLINNSQTDDDLYPRANDFDGSDDDYLDELHNMMDEAGDEAHDEDWEDKPSFANNKPENRWRDLRHLADSTFDSDTMEQVIENKQKNKKVEHNLGVIQEELPDYSNVRIVREEPEEEPSPGTPEGEEPEDSGDDESAKNGQKRKFLIAGAIIVIYVVISR